MFVEGHGRVSGRAGHARAEEQPSQDCRLDWTSGRQRISSTSTRRAACTPRLPLTFPIGAIRTARPTTRRPPPTLVSPRSEDQVQVSPMAAGWRTSPTSPARRRCTCVSSPTASAALAGLDRRRVRAEVARRRPRAVLHRVRPADDVGGGHRRRETPVEADARLRSSGRRCWARRIRTASSETSTP